MIPVEIHLSNFMCYRGEQPPLRFEGLHVACLSGENGAGKSALLDAITWALWGKARMSSDELIAQHESEMVVDFSFIHNQQRYRVIRRRQLSRKGKKTTGKTTLDLQIRDGESWRPLGTTTVTETDRMIEDLLRMSYDTFTNASYLIQGRADEFQRKPPAERKQVLAEILDLQEYAMLEERAKNRAKKLDGQVRELDGRISHLQHEAEKATLYEQYVYDAQERVASLTSQVTAAEQAKTQADEQVRALETKRARRQELAKHLQQLASDKQQQKAEAATLQAAIDEAEALLQRREEIADGILALTTAQAEVERLDNLRPRFDELTEERRQHQEALKDVLRRLESEKEGWQREVQRLTKELAQRPSLEKDLQVQEEHLATLAPLAEQLTGIREEISTLDQRISQAHSRMVQQSKLANSINQQHDKLTSERQQLAREGKRLQDYLDQAADWQEQLTTAFAEQEKLQQTEATLATLKTQDQQLTDSISTQRANCDRYKQQAEEIKQRKELLHDTASSATTCPLCQSELGEGGVEIIQQHYEQELETLRHSYSEAKKMADAQEKERQAIRKEIKQHEKHKTQAEKATAGIDHLQQQLAQVSQWETELEQTQATLTTLDQQLEQGDYAREEREALLTVEEELTQLGAEQTEVKRGKEKGSTRWSLEAIEQQRKTLQDQQQTLEKQLESRTTLESKAATLRDKLERLTEIEAQLPEAEQHVTDLETTIANNDFGHEIRTAGKAVDAQLAELGYSNEAHTAARNQVKQLAHWQKEQQDLNLAASKLEHNQQAIQRIESLLERYERDYAAYQQEDATLAQETRAYPEAQKHANACANTLQEQRKHLTAAQNDLTEKQTLYKTAQEAAEQLTEKQQERQTLTEQHQIFQELAEAFGKRGVQAMLIETAVPEIEHEANRLLGRMTDNQMHVTFDMQRETKKGTTQETLDINIADTLGTRSYDAFSGGETMRINFAIRVALSRLLAHRAGASLETLVIDEGFGVLDAEGRERFVEAITSVQDDFQCILVVTHIDELKDRFPTQIRITKQRGGSVWEVV